MYVAAIHNPANRREVIHIGPFAKRQDAKHYIEWTEDNEGLTGSVIEVLSEDGGADAIRDMSERHEMTALKQWVADNNVPLL